MSSNDPGDSESTAKEIEQLLTKAMGPMAKLLFGRARKKGGDDHEVLNTVAAYIEDDAERKKFLSAARRVLSGRQKIEGSATLALGREAPAQGAAEPPPPAAEPPPLPPARDPVTEGRPAPRTMTREPVTESRSAPRTISGGEPAMKPGAIFVSYARDNLEVAQRLVETLRAAGLEVWLDMGQLQPGDAWDLKIRRNIEACSFFLPLVSRETQARPEGYFRREWNIAADRALNFADDVPFLLPVTIDDTAAYSARVPERFRGAHWSALPGGEATQEFVDHLRALVDEYRSQHPSE